MKRFLFPAVFCALLFVAAPAGAQTIGTFRWQLLPFGSVVELTVTQQGTIFLLHGKELQCGNNRSLPVSGVAVPQANGQVFLGFTSINENGRGIHTRAYVNLTDFNGNYADNAGNSSITMNFAFNPGTTCPGGLRTGPTNPDQGEPQQ